jgi:predicted acetyltransferase
MLDLVKPTVRLHGSWLDAHNEWGAGVHEDGFGLLATDEVESSVGFATWVQRLSGKSESAEQGVANGERCEYRWIVDDDRVFGGIALRYGDDEVVQRLGNVGYGIRPSQRGRGLATWALTHMIGEALAVGLNRLLLICEHDNVASAKTIAANAGIAENNPDPGLGRVRRYWIEIR